MCGQKETSGGGVILNLANGLGTSFQYKNPAALAAGVLGCYWGYAALRKSQAAHIGLMWLGTFVFVFVGGQRHAYYSLISSAFLPFGLIAVFQVIEIFGEKLGNVIRRPFDKICCGAVLLISVGLALLCTSNRYLMGVDKNELPQYQFADIVGQYEGVTLLNYGFLDGGFYTTCNIIPNCRAFCALNIPIPELPEQQKYYAENGLCDFLVSRDEELYFEKYECIAESSFYFEGSDFTYYLYKLRER